MEDRHTTCNNTFSRDEKELILILMSSIGLVSLSACILIIIFVFTARLHKSFVYRLAMYQVASSMLLSINDVLVITLSSYVSKEGGTFHHAMCQLTGFMLTYLMWIKLILTTGLLFHFFSLAICLVDIRRLEIPYVVLSTLLPLLLAWIPFINNNYGSVGGWCWIRVRSSDCGKYEEGISEQYVLWYGPCYVFLIVSVIGAVAAVVILRRRHNMPSEREPLIANQFNNHHSRLLFELLPLLAYPVIFFLFNLLPMIESTYNIVSSHKNYKMTLARAFVNSFCGILSSGALLGHLLMVRHMDKLPFQTCVPLTPILAVQQDGRDQRIKNTSYMANKARKSKVLIPQDSDFDNDFVVMEEEDS